MNVSVKGGTPEERSKVSRLLMQLPAWYVAAARVRDFVITDRPEVQSMIASYAHGTRDVSIMRRPGDILFRALAHELAHGLDDWTEEYGNPHVFSATKEWIQVHQMQGYAEIRKYGDDMRESFADAVSLYLLDDHYRVSHPRESRIIGDIVFPWLQSIFVR